MIDHDWSQSENNHFAALIEKLLNEDIPNIRKYKHKLVIPLSFRNQSSQPHLLWTQDSYLSRLKGMVSFF